MSKILHVNVANKVATYQKRDGAIVCGNKDYQLKFTFDAEWAEHENKTARFLWGGDYFNVEFTGDTCDVPMIMGTEIVEVGVYAGDLETTTGAEIPCRLSILCKGGKPHPETGQHYTAEAVAAAEAAAASASSAKTSETNAKASETSARASETSARASETSARASETNAATSATQAKGYMETAQAIAADAVNMDARITRNSKRITNLEKGTVPDPFETDSSVAYQKVIPAEALPFAEVAKVGGRSHKCENRIPYPYAFTTNKVSGVTFTANSDGSISVSGTATANASQFIKKIESLPRGTYCLTGTKGGVSVYLQFWNGGTWVKEIWVNGSFTVDFSNYTAIDVVAYVASGTTVSTTIYPMINEGSTALPYEPYFKGLRESVVTEVKGIGANLAKPRKDLTAWGCTINSIDESGLFTITSTNDYAAVYAIVARITLEKGVTYSLSFTDAKKLMRFVVWDAGTTRAHIDTAGTTGTVKAPKTGEYDIAVYLASGSSIAIGTVCNFRLMVNVGSTALPFALYKENTLAIPASVQALDGYGIGVDATYCNHIAWSDNGGVKTYHQKVHKRVFDGTESGWSLVDTDGGGKRFQFYNATNKPLVVDVAKTSPLVCSHLPAKSANETWDNQDGASMQGEMFYIKDARYTTVEKWKAHLAELSASGDPFTIVYAAAAPTATDISHHITDDNMIEVEGGGSIVAENANKQSAPTTITYQLREVSE